MSDPNLDPPAPEDAPADQTATPDAAASDSAPSDAAAPDTPTTDDAAATESATSKAPAPATNASASATATATVGAPNKRDVLRDAFLLGSGIVELKNRIQISLLKPHESGLRLASVWRASFNRLAALQVKAFRTSTTAGTLYAPPDATVLPYLYPKDPDYANVGIVGKAADGAVILKDFKLYDVMRRAINCLTLLYVKEEESLIPRDLKRDQDHLIEVILQYAQDPQRGGGDPQAIADIASPPQATPLDTAKAVLTERTIKFLDAWDGYLRENYYAGGMFENDDLELVAYEAGHSMSSFSWGIASATESLEHRTEKAGVEEFVMAWQKVFRPQNVTRLQHQISALSSELDDAYYLEDPARQRPPADAVLIMPNPDLPSESIKAVKQSIDYWQRAIEWIPHHLPQLRDDNADQRRLWSNNLRLALVEQSNIWQTLMTGQQSLRAYNMESVTHEIMRDVTVKIQESVREDFSGSVRQAEQAMKQVAEEVKQAIDAAQDIAVKGLEDLFRRYKRYILPIIGVIIGVFILVLILVLVKQEWAVGAATGGTGLTGVMSAILGYLGLKDMKDTKQDKQTAIQTGNDAAKTKVDNQATAASAPEAAAAGGGNSMLTRIQGATQQTGSLIVDALERGYKQARIELDGLSRSVAVAYPLVEFFGLNFEVKSNASLLTQIIWSDAERKAEIERVTRAAFGSLSVFIVPPATNAEESGGTESKQPGEGANPKASV